MYMRIKDNLMLRKIAGQWIVIPMGDMVVRFNGIISLNETSAFLWRRLEEGQSQDMLLQSLRAEYDVEQDVAAQDIQEFLTELASKGLLETADET